MPSEGLGVTGSGAGGWSASLGKQWTEGLDERDYTCQALRIRRADHSPKAEPQNNVSWALVSTGEGVGKGEGVK